MHLSKMKTQRAIGIFSKKFASVQILSFQNYVDISIFHFCLDHMPDINYKYSGILSDEI